MKKGVVLFISLLFIAAVSLLIIKNLEDTDSYINEQNSKFTKTQIMMYFNNAKNEIANVLKENEAQNSDKTDYREVLKEYTSKEFPIMMQDAIITIRLEEYDKYNINLLKEKDEEKYKYLKDFLIRNDIYDIELLKKIYEEYTFELKDKNQINNKQLDFILEKFEKESYNTEILKVKDYIGFQPYDKKSISQNDKEKEINFYELFVQVEYLKQFAKAYYILNKKGEVTYFEFSFK